MTIRNTISAALLACTAISAQAGAAATAAPAPQAPSSSVWTGSVTLGYDTDYIFRGQEVSTDNVSTRLDLNYGLSAGSTLNLNAWYTNSTDSNFDELNLTATVNYKLSDCMTIGPSLRHYSYPTSNANTELEFGVALGTAVGGLPVNLAAYYNEETEGYYLELGTSKSFKVSDTLNLVTSAAIGYMDTDAGVSDLSHATVSVALPINLNGVTLTPYVAGNFPLDGIDAITTQDDEIVGGVSLKVGF